MKAARLRQSTLLAALLLIWAATSALADTTINPTNRYAFGANVGWLDWLGDTNHGVVIGPQVCSGYIFSPNLGWINVGNGNPANGIQYQNLSANDFGVNVDSSGNLRGYAFGANIGWVNFENNGDARVDLASGRLSGFAFSSACGWISLSNTVAYVQTGNAPAIIAPPQDLLVTAGQTATFKVVAGGLPPLSYQWLFNGVEIPGTALSEFSRANAQAADAGNYSVVVRNAFGSVTATAALVVGFPEIAVEQPAGHDLTSGSSSVDFGTVLRRGRSQLTFTIRNTGNGQLFGLGTTIDGANAADFTVTANPTAPVPPGGNITLTVTYAPHGSGMNVAVLHIASNDADESSFDIALIGKVRPPVPSGTVITVAGNGNQRFSGDGGPATEASFDTPSSLVVGPDGTLYIEDAENSRIRAINPTNGIITTIAGDGTTGESGDGGLAINASLDIVSTGLAVDPERNTLYTVQTDFSRVRAVNLGAGIINNFAGVGQFDPFHVRGEYGDGLSATQAWFVFTWGVAVGRSNDVFIGDSGHCRIRKVSGATGIITTIAGREDVPGVPKCGSTGDGGPASEATVQSPFLLATDPAGNLFIREGVDGRVRRIDVNTQIITTVAGGGTSTNYNGVATDMDLSAFGGIAVNDSGELFIGVLTQILKVDLATGMLSVFAGTGVPGFSGDGGAATDAQFEQIYGLAVVPGGGLVVSDPSCECIRYIAPGAANLTGDSSQIVFDLPWVSALNGDLTVSDDPNLTTLKGGSLTSVGGDIIVTGNASLSTVDLGSLESSSGDITLKSNRSNLVADLSSLCNFGNDTKGTTLTLDATTVALSDCLTIGTNATLAGSATLEGSITNNGTISPGSSPGHFDITGNLVLGNSSKLVLQLGGYEQAQIDSLNVRGSVRLGGVLSVSLIDNFPDVMTNGASFTLLTAGAPLDGTFSNVASGGALTTTDGRARFTVLYEGMDSLRLTNLQITGSVLDSDGDGVSDVNEILAGTDPANPASYFGITAIRQEGGGLRLTWNTIGGKSYRVQTTSALSEPFADLGPRISVDGSGQSTTNILDNGAATNGSTRYYRVRLEP